MRRWRMRQREVRGCSPAPPSNRFRRAAALVAVLAVFAAGAARHPARSEDRDPHAADANGCVRSAFRVVLDTGHTAEAPGAESARGVTEFDFNLKFADAIRQALLDAGFDKTVRLITTTAHVRGLLERATRANEMHADLFIAVHHNSVPENLIEKWEYQGEERKFSDRFTGYSIFISQDNGDRDGSLEFGQLLGTALQARGLAYTPHYTLALMGRHRRQLVDPVAGVYRYDQLIVLRFTRMPAVLLEAGSIVNRKEELELAKPERRALAASAVAAAVEDFCASRSRAAAGRHAGATPQKPVLRPPVHASPATLAR